MPRPRPLINYNLRPAKNIERKMMAEAFGRLAAICPLPRYRYVGFGSEFFNDFALFHQVLGVKDMTSIEEDQTRIARCAFNRPYKCVKLKPGNSGAVLPTLSWAKRVIVWLDYMDRLNKAILADAALLVSQVRSGSALVWTVNAHPVGDARHGESASAQLSASEWPEKRLAQLKEDVGENRVRAELKGSELGQWGWAEESYSILREEIDRALHDRNGTEAADQQLTFRQFLHFRYQDGARMLTIGGALVNAADDERLRGAFDDLPFVREGKEAAEIAPPTLTGKEVRHLNRMLPRHKGKLKTPGWLTSKERESYQDLYRYYPIFAESEL